MDDKRLEKIRESLQRLLMLQGRDDIGVGEIAEVDGKVRFTLIRGHFTHTDELPLEVFDDPQIARDRVTPAIFRLSKQVEREHIEQAGT